MVLHETLSYEDNLTENNIHTVHILFTPTYTRFILRYKTYIENSNIRAFEMLTFCRAYYIQYMKSIIA